jgi:hypothetical protein
MLYHFIELLKLHGDDVSDISSIINGFGDFIQSYNDFRRVKKDYSFESQNLQRFAIYHTIKPGTQYYDQQKIVDGKPIHYPVYHFFGNELESSAPGSNYPLDDCILYIRTGDKVVKIKS